MEEACPAACTGAGQVGPQTRGRPELENSLASLSPKSVEYGMALLWSATFENEYAKPAPAALEALARARENGWNG